ncbi:MAG: amino acid permease [Hyphomonadaceae bacterium]|nr:MAG: basic amino acid/polyamine antiporter APA family [Caulobacteraceae bacterium]MBT9444077.1 amino acid permease [Hyphomonadaceae bacterium]TPW03892.1 MAG: basic amino acid/polyamine antiporter, APA family [Alphaproteobacteria bacterium]
MAGQTKPGGLGRIFLRKSVEQMHAEHEQGELKKTLGAWNLILLGIGCIIGTGIFVLTGRAAAEFAGPGIMISFVITGTLCALVALAYAELAAAIPVSGSAYSYSYASMGEIVAWVMGLLLVLEYGLAASTVAVGWSGYVVSFLADYGIHIPAALQAAPGVPVTDHDTGAVIGTGMVNLPALIAIGAVTMLLTLGVSESASVNNVIVFIKVGVVIAFIVIGASHVDPALWSPLIPEQIPAPAPGTDMAIGAQITRALGGVLTGADTGQYGVPGLITGAATIFFAYIGFEAVSTAGAESKNPSRDMPIGILGSLIICTILYILTCAVLVGIVPYALLDNPAPIAMAVDRMGLPWFATVVKIGAIAGLSSVMLVLLYGQTRIFYTMARDGLIPQVFANVHSKFKTPWVNTILVGLLASGFAGFMGLDDLADLTNVGTLAAFAIICITVIYLRFARPNMKRPFNMPMPVMLVVSVLGALMCIFLLMSLMAHDKTRNFFLIYLAGGFVLYFVYGLQNSKLAKGLTVGGHEAKPMELPHKGD